MFYRQLLRWLVGETPRRVITSTPKQVLSDESLVKLRAEVRDKTYLPAIGRDHRSAHPGPRRHRRNGGDAARCPEAGVYSADWTTPKPGSYLVEVTAKRGNEDLGRDVMTFRREDGVAENFHTEQNRELLEKLSSETGGRYYNPGGGKAGRRTSVTRMPASRCARPATCGTCRSCSCCC